MDRFGSTNSGVCAGEAVGTVSHGASRVRKALRRPGLCRARHNLVYPIFRPKPRTAGDCTKLPELGVELASPESFPTAAWALYFIRKPLLHAEQAKSLNRLANVLHAKEGDVIVEEAWQAEATDLATRPYTERFYLASGRLLPIWNLLGDEAQVRRLVTQDGRSLLGRIVPAEAVNMLLDKLGLGDRISLSPDQLVEAALGGKVVPIDALSGASIKRSRVNGEQRLEVLGFDPRALASWKAKGCFTEIIQHLDQEATVSCDLSDGVSYHSS